MSRWNGFTCVRGATFSTAVNVIPIRGSYLSAKGREKGPWLSGAQELAGYAMAPNRRRRLKKAYITDKAHSHSPLGSQVENRVLYQ